MAAKKPLLKFGCRIELRCETKATSDPAARDKFMKAVRSIYKEVRVRGKELIHVEEGWSPR